MARILYQSLGAYTIKENYRPDWLTGENGNRLELDFFLPELHVAIEVQGQQHYRYIQFLHRNHTGFLQRLARDDIKRMTCEKNGIRLFEVAGEQDAKCVIRDILDTILCAENDVSKIERAVIEQEPRRYTKTIRKHIRRLQKLMAKQPANIDKAKCIADKIRVNLVAIEQYQKDKGIEIDFEPDDMIILECGRKIVNVHQATK